jgi:thiol:disulfide interchange protein DsbC
VDDEPVAGGVFKHPSRRATEETDEVNIMRTAPALLLSCLMALPASGAEDGAAGRILDRLKVARPDIEFGMPMPSQIPGMYEVHIGGGQVLYATADGKYFIQGEVLTIENNEFVRVPTAIEREMPAKRRELLALVKPEDVILFAPPPPQATKATVTVFTDIDCGYCRKFHKEVPELNKRGIAVRYLAFPRSGLDSASYRKIATAWCASDRQDALTRLKNGETLPDNVCAGNPVAAQYALGEEVGVNGTPALILPDGTLAPGYRTAAELAHILGVP